MQKEKSQKTTKRNAALTRAKIIEIATTEFADNSYAGARVDNIVKKSGISKNLLYYHFSSKENLFVEVLEEAYAKLRAYHKKIIIRDLSSVEGVKELVRFTFQYFIDHPEFLSLVNTENLYFAKHLKKSKKIQEMYNPLIDNLGHLLQKGASEAIFKPGINPIELYISIVGLGYFYLSSQHTLSVIFDIDLSTDEHLETRREHMIDVILGYLSLN
ncbi:MAG: TetR/AcrR family transcriptional regulator [Desulfobulbaceae bacterium]|nr:TetR/AcrR family transcriptional regulator [Desulfobulbaceae bacterium]